MVSLHLDCGCVSLNDGSRAPGCPRCRQRLCVNGAGKLGHWGC